MDIHFLYVDQNDLPNINFYNTLIHLYTHMLIFSIIIYYLYFNLETYLYTNVYININICLYNANEFINIY